MTQTFVPFAAFAQPSPEPLAAPAGRNFAPMPAAARPAEQPRPAAPAAHQPVVKLHREGDVVKHIQIQCSCGQVIDLDCVY